MKSAYFAVIASCLLFAACSCQDSGETAEDSLEDNEWSGEDGSRDMLILDEGGQEGGDTGQDIVEAPWDQAFPDPQADSSDIHEEIDFGHGIAAPCETAEDCFEVEGEPVCLRDDWIFIGGYCTMPCENDGDCPLGDTCTLGGHGYEFVCALGCKSGDECPREGYSCRGGICYFGEPL